jgi:hypothetical protein
MLTTLKIVSDSQFKIYGREQKYFAMLVGNKESQWKDENILFTKYDN